MKTKTIYVLIFIMLISLGTSNIIHANDNLQEVYKSLTLKIMKSNVENKTGLQNDLFDLIYEHKELLEKEELTKIIEKTDANKIMSKLKSLIEKRKTENEMSFEEIKYYNNQKQSVFTGFFSNPDYSNPKNFLGHGEQSKITEVTYSFVEDINNKKDFSTLSEIFKKLSLFDSFDESVNKLELYSRYKTEDYIKERKLYGCTSYGLVIANMARAKGIPAIVVEGLKLDFIKDFQNGDFQNTISGHMFIEVLIDNKWYLIDSTRGRLYLDYNTKNNVLPNENFLLGKGIDRWEFGMKMKEYFNEESGFFDMVSTIKFDNYSIPKYEYIDLKTMRTINPKYQTKIQGVELEDKVIYYFDAGKNDGNFREILQNNIKKTNHGFIYNYLKNYKQYKNEADILILSSNIPYHNFPDEIKDKMSKEKYYNLTAEFNLIKVQNADVFIVKSS